MAQLNNIMRNFIIFIGLVLFFLPHTSAQSFSSMERVDPIKWETLVEQQNDSIYHLIFKADIGEGWHLYSQNKMEGTGPIPTKFNFTDAPKKYILIGKTKEPDRPTSFDPIFGKSIKYFENQVIFVQSVKVIYSGEINIEASIRFMLCDNHRCIAPETLNFEFNLNK